MTLSRSGMHAALLVCTCGQFAFLIWSVTAGYSYNTVDEYSYHSPGQTIAKMPISSLLHRLGKFPLVNIFKRQIKSRLSFHPFHGTYWRKTKLHEDVFGGDHPLSGSSEVHYGGEVPPQDYELVISYLEL